MMLHLGRSSAYAGNLANLSGLRDDRFDPWRPLPRRDHQDFAHTPSRDYPLCRGISRRPPIGGRESFVCGSAGKFFWPGDIFDAAFKSTGKFENCHTNAQA
jgi:hypothetical protein